MRLREFSPSEFVAYRALPALGGLAIALFRWVHRWADPRAVDPDSLRALAALSCAGVVITSHAGDRRAVRVAAYAACIVVTAWILALLALNRFSIGYALTLLIVMAASAASFETDLHLQLYYGSALGLLFLLAVMTPGPRVPLVIYLPFATMLCLLSYVALALRRRSELELARSSQSYVTARNAAEAELVRQTLFHPQTGLANRALCLDRLDRLTRRTASCPGHAAFAVLFVDVDRFRVVNDSLGHPTGDRILVEIARRLEPLARANDTLAHFGGDDFVLVLDGVDGEAALRAARQVRRAVARPYALEEHEVSLSVTVGIALGGNVLSAEELLRDAELAMHRAKSARGNRVQIFDGQMHREALERLRLEAELRQALERGEVRAHFQPIADLRSGEVVGFEALARWLHPRRGLLLPAEFLALAEETGLILPLGYAVLREAGAAIAGWKAGGAAAPVGVHVNLSPSQLLDARLIEEVTDVLCEFELLPGELGIEVTEGAVLGDPPGALDQLTRLRALGVRVAVDDFGTGYSSLAYLHRLPVDTLKIDRSFIAELGGGDPLCAARERELVATIVLLARNLRLDVIAEGIEAPAQLEAVRSLGCDRGQGHFLAPPLPAAECMRLILRPSREGVRGAGQRGTRAGMNADVAAGANGGRPQVGVEREGHDDRGHR